MAKDTGLFKNIYIGKESECRRFIEAVAWIAGRSPMAFSSGFIRQMEHRLQTLFTLGGQRRMETNVQNVFQRSVHGKSYDRQRDCSLSSMRGRSSQKKGGQTKQALGRSRGGFTTKIHIAVDSLGNPLRFFLTGGQESDIAQAEALINGYSFCALIADKGYDSDSFVISVYQLDSEAAIPPRINRTRKRDYDRRLYRERHLIECFINKIKHFRRIFSRFEKLSARYLAFPHIVSVLIWLRSNVNTS